ncbi:hypothetical protein CVT25_003768 [Psilocybe cyanescens]|uniref:Uncharacterized protein n=1 Tax=Psilocybe cyanescens TaxID=93625 RepID=A0A409XKM7_PSICY|nr:hypothetical protein CVT25_003768 [Psilocybe cyanescens]
MRERMPTGGGRRKEKAEAEDGERQAEEEAEEGAGEGEGKNGILVPHPPPPTTEPQPTSASKAKPEFVMGILARKVVGVHLAMLDTDYCPATRGAHFSDGSRISHIAMCIHPPLHHILLLLRAPSVELRVRLLEQCDGEEREHQEGAIVIIEGLSALALPDELRGRASLQTNEVQYTPPATYADETLEEALDLVPTLHALKGSSTQPLRMAILARPSYSILKGHKASSQDPIDYDAPFSTSDGVKLPL